MINALFAFHFFYCCCFFCLIIYFHCCFAHFFFALFSSFIFVRLFLCLGASFFLARIARISNVYEWTYQSNKMETGFEQDQTQFGMNVEYAFPKPILSSYNFILATSRCRCCYKLEEKNTFLFVSYVIIVISGLRWTHIVTDKGTTASIENALQKTSDASFFSFWLSKQIFIRG